MLLRSSLEQGKNEERQKTLSFFSENPISCHGRLSSVDLVDRNENMTSETSGIPKSIGSSISSSKHHLRIIFHFWTAIWSSLGVFKSYHPDNSESQDKSYESAAGVLLIVVGVLLGLCSLTSSTSAGKLRWPPDQLGCVQQAWGKCAMIIPLCWVAKVRRGYNFHQYSLGC